MQQDIQRLVQVVPAPRQIAWQKLEFTAFLHFGMNTFTNREWGTGTENPALFAPSMLDTDQWCQALVAAGIRACIFTAKHHDGFCLWNTRTTSHSVMHSPCKQDIVGLIAQSCKKYGLGLGLYLSPWDRHEPCYGTGEAYDDFFCSQLQELTANYGPLYCLWFDGACGEGENGKVQQYNWERYYAIIRENQPNAVISVCGPDVRWCGNEAGSCRPTEWSVVPAALQDTERIKQASQQQDDDSFRAQTLSADMLDLGSREFVQPSPQLVWYPAEVNVSIRPGWFYHPEEDTQVKPLDTLLEYYVQAAGGNAMLLLNIPPDTAGRIHAQDAERLQQLGAAIGQMFRCNVVTGGTAAASSQQPGCEALHILTDDETYWKAPDGTEQAEIIIQLPQAAEVCTVVLQEQITQSQRIEKFTLLADTPQGTVPIYSGTTVGYKKICRFTPLLASRIIIRIEQSRIAPTLRFAGVYT